MRDTIYIVYGRYKLGFWPRMFSHGFYLIHILLYLLVLKTADGIIIIKYPLLMKNQHFGQQKALHYDESILYVENFLRCNVILWPYFFIVAQIA